MIRRTSMVAQWFLRERGRGKQRPYWRVTGLGVLLISFASIAGAQGNKGTDVSKVVRDWTWLVALAIVIGCPIAWWIMHWWLQDYVYRMTPGAGIFLGSAVLVMFIALLTVSWQALKSGTSNPAGALRSE